MGFFGPATLEIYRFHQHFNDMLKRYSTILLAAAMSLAATSAQADDTVYKVGGINYQVISETAAMVAEQEGNEETLNGDIVIPATVTLGAKEYTVTAIDGTAFKNCTGITSMTLPSTIDSICYQVFNGCTNMVSCNLEDTKIRELCVSTFLYCRSLRSITIPATVTKIGINPFMETNSLAEIKLAPGNKCFKTYDGALYTISGKTLISSPGGKTDLTLLDGLDTIANSAFCQNRRIHNVTIPNSVTRIESSAFMRCDSLQLITIPTSLTYLGSSAFADCRQAKGDLVLPASLKTMSSKCFYYTSITSMDASRCVDTSVPNSFVMYCTKLRTVKLPLTATQIWDNALNTVAISEIDIPETVTRIRGSAMQGCTLLKKVTMGSKITTLDFSVFAKDAALTEINISAATPPSIGNSSRYPAFPDAVYTGCTLNVPAGSVDAYRAADVWKNFTSIKTLGVASTGADSDISVARTADGLAVLGAPDGAAISVHAISGALVYSGTEAVISLPAGLYIVRVAGRTFKVMK